jgi:hypothetical protein
VSEASRGKVVFSHFFFPALKHGARENPWLRREAGSFFAKVAQFAHWWVALSESKRHRKSAGYLGVFPWVTPLHPKISLLRLMIGLK